MRREFLAVSRLSHPGCVTMFAEGAHHDQRYLVMEYVRGGSLEHLSSASAEVLLSVLVRLAETLDHVHGRGILHRDIKPAIYRARRGDSKAARALFDRALAERGSASNLSFPDLWFRAPNKSLL